MDDNSKEEDCKENSGQQNNNTMATETSQTTSGNTSKKDSPEHEKIINQKTLNEKNNFCDNDNATIAVPHGEKEKVEGMDEIGNKGEAANMEIGSPQKRVTEDSDCSVPTIVNRDGISNASGNISLHCTFQAHNIALSPK